MKALITLIFAALVVTATPALANNGNDDSVAVVSSRYKNLFVFKTEKKFVGATIEVISASGDIVTAQTLNKRKMIIDFCDVKTGAYKIRVTKGTKVKEFVYVKK